jgi:subtilase family protein
MSSGKMPRRAARALSFATAALAAALAPSLASAAERRPSDGDLSARLAELAKPSLRSAPLAEQARRLSVATGGAGSLLREGKRIVADVRFDRGAGAGADDLRAAGAEVLHASARYQTVTVAVKAADLRSIAALPRVAAVTEVVAPLLSATECAGLVTSEGDSQLRAANARTAFNVDGSGVTVGILSDSFDRDGTAPTHAANDIASGDLPGPGNRCGRTNPTSLLDDSDGGGADEGRAMAQIVHDLAPGARLAFASATALNSPFAFADNIRALRAAGADVLADDVLYLEEPFFQDGPVAVAANQVVAAGATYFSAAGNNNLIDGGRNFASWEAPEFRDTACPAELQAPPIEAEPCMDFDPGAGADPTFEIAVAKDATLTLDLQWAQPWDGVTADLDAFLLDSVDKPLKVGELFVGSAEDNVEGSQMPIEIVQWENKTGSSQKVRLAVPRCFGPCNPAADSSAKPRLKLALLQNGGGVTATEYEESSGGDTVGPTIFGQSGAASAIGVGAVPFSNGSTVEPYSSRGPVTHYFGPVSGVGPAPPLGPQVIAKPDLAATDGGANTFFGQNLAGVWRFFGTSAAAPHAAAVAALMRQANPSASVAQLRLALAATADPVGAFGPDAVGAGLVDAFGAVSSVALPPTVSITERPPPLGNNPRPSVGFAANRPASFTCSLDGEALRPCASPFVPATRLSEGSHGFMVSATDVAGRSGQSEIVSFEIDTRPPRTFFRKRPPKTIRTRHRKAKAVFGFGSNERNVTFICRVDGGLPRFCKRRFVRRFRVGPHVLRVKAKDAAGNVDRTPAVHRFKVKRRGG